MEKHRKAILTEPVSVNLTQAQPSDSSSPMEPSSPATESFPTGTSHVTAHAENNNYNSEAVVLAVEVAVLVSLNVRFVTKVVMTPLSVITGIRNPLLCRFHLNVLPSIHF